MKKLCSAIILSLLVSVGGAATTPTPIKPIPRELFIPVYIDKSIVDDFATVKPTKPPLPKITVKPKVVIKAVSTKNFILDRNVSWYGPGFYGKRTACGFKYTTKLLGVAHRTLPCGTLVTFHYNGRTKTVPVIDRGPYVSGRQWDLSGGLCVALHHCFTGKIYYRIEHGR